MVPKYFRDFSGGYADAAEQTNLPDTVLGAMTNYYWDGRLKKKRGAAILTTSVVGGAVGIFGIIHNYLLGTGFIVAMQDAANVKFYAWDAGTGWTVIGSKTFTLGYENIYFAYLNGYVIATNMHDKPLAIWYTGGVYYSNDLEQVDARARDNADWKAGQYVAGTATYANDTTDAQSAAADDFAISTVTANDGFWIACFYTFTKVILTDAHQMTGAPVFVYEYYKGNGAWGTLTLTSTPAWTAAAGNKTLEFDMPLDWVAYDVDAETNLVNRFVIRVRHETAPTNAVTSGLLTVSFTRSVSWALQNQTAGIVITHGGRLWISAGELTAYSGYNVITGFESYFIEYFQGGTKVIYNLVSFQNALYVFKSDSVWKYAGTSFDNYIKSKICDIGSFIQNCAVATENAIIFYGTNKMYLLLASDSVTEILSHVNISSLSYMTYFDKKIWATVPLNGQYVFDPIKIIEIGGVPCIAGFDLITAGDEYTKRVVKYSASVDYLIGISGSTVSIVRYDTSNFANESTGAAPFITMVKTKLLDYGLSSTRKVVPRIKVEMLDGEAVAVVFKDGAGLALASGTLSAKHEYAGLTEPIVNGGFESALSTGWGDAVGTAVGTSRDTGTFRSGAASLKIKPVFATGTDTGIAQGFSPTGADPLSYYLSGYYRCTSFSTGKVVIDVGSALTHVTSFIYANLATITAVSSGWVKFGKAISVRSVGAYLKIYSPTGSSSTCYIDDITVYPLTKFVTHEFSPPYQVDGKNFALELSQTSLAETSIKSIGIEYSPRRF